MNFWQENRAFVIVIAAVALAMFFLWPSLFDLGPSIVSFHRTTYDTTQRERRQKKVDLDKCYNPPGKGIPFPVARALEEVKQANQVLLSNFEEMHRWMSDVPRFPFRIPDARKDEERKGYVSLCYTYLQTGELIAEVPGRKEYKILEPYDGLSFGAGARRIKIGEPWFGLRDMAIPETIKNPDCSILQLALLHDLGHLAIRVGVDEISGMSPGEPYTWAIKGTSVAKAYPINLHVSSDLPTLLALLHGLDGSHGRVVEAPPPVPEEAPAAASAAAPAEPKPRPAAAGEPKAEEPAPPEPQARPAAKPEGPARAEPKKARPAGAQGPQGEQAAPTEPKPRPPAAEDAKEGRPGAAEPKDHASPKIIIELEGDSSFYAPTKEKEQAGLRERLTIFRPSATDPHDLKFIANVIITHDLGDGRAEAEPEPFSSRKGDGLRRRLRRVEAELEPFSDLVFGADGKTIRNAIQKGDLASSRFFLVRGLKIKVVDAKVDKDRDGFPTDVIPAHLDAELSVAALEFIKSEMPRPQATEPSPAAAEPTAPRPSGKARPRL